MIAEEGAVAAGAEFANIAVLDAPVGDSNPLGDVSSPGREVWLPSLSDSGARHPFLLEDAIEAGLASAAFLRCATGTRA